MWRARRGSNGWPRRSRGTKRKATVPIHSRNAPAPSRPHSRGRPRGRRFMARRPCRPGVGRFRSPCLPDPPAALQSASPVRPGEAALSDPGVLAYNACATESSHPVGSRTMSEVVLQSQVPGHPCRRGKVRDVYDLGDRLVIVATDRLSAFDWVLPTGIPDKGRILTALSLFWFDFLGVENHLLGTDLHAMGQEFVARADELAGRIILARKARVVPIECVVRGYLAGSGWKEYQAGGAVCGVPLPPGLRQSERLPEPIFTPATKADVGHDENI